ncbi:MAG: hypothetical protein P8Y80_14370 [Acidobacteriota bacterium]|jgi:hypothetical protein
MKRYMLAAAITAICLALFCSFPSMNQQAQAASTEQITVLNPMGTPPPIQAKKMAPRLDTLDGKTIYFVNTGYIGTDRLMAVMTDWFKANYPNTNIAMARGGMTNIPENVRAEIAEKGDAAIIGLGH